jgi:hypothetical protein
MRVDREKEECCFGNWNEIEGRAEERAALITTTIYDFYESSMMMNLIYEFNQ